MKFSRRRQKWIKERKNPMLVGSALRPNAAVARRYEAELDKIIAQAMRDYRREIERMYNTTGVAMDANMGSQARILMNGLGRKWRRLFNRHSKRIVEGLVKQTEKSASANLNASLSKLSGGLAIKTPKMPADLEGKVTASIAENVSLIKSIGEELHQKIEGVVLRSVQQGGEGVHEIYKAALETVDKTGKSAHKRAKLIAELETAKISSTIQTERMESVGITKFRWRHSGGGAEPRELHLRYDGQIFEINNPPIIDERTGQRGMPGTIWNCGCFAEPIIEFDED